MGPTRSETSVRNYHYLLRNSTEELSSQLWTELSVSTLIFRIFWGMTSCDLSKIFRRFGEV